MFVFSLLAFILVTIVNRAIYFVYLEKFYDKSFDRWAVLVSPDLLISYWRWMPGTILNIANVLLCGLPFILLWVAGRRRSNRPERAGHTSVGQRPTYRRTNHQG